MTDNFNYVFQYLEKENISIDKTEFEFQIQSHPDYPSLLSIADTLSFFNIDNGAISVKLSEIELLPERFVASLKEENKESQLYFIEKKGGVYFCSNNKKPVALSKLQLESRWDNLVLLVEKSEAENVAKANKSKWFWILPLLCIIFFVAILLQFQDNIQTKFFFLFPIIGVLFSTAALKDLFGAKSELLNSFCNLTGSSSCSLVVGSSKWKIFEIVNFSDLSIVFFASQFLGLLAFMFMNDATDYFNIQKIMLIGAVPVLFASVYYQKFVEKKWCPICLVIIGIIVLELGYVLFLGHIAFDFSIQSVLVFGFVFVAVALVWTILKKPLTRQKELKEFQIKANRFMRNYEIFKNTLVSSVPINDNPIQSGAILLGNTDAPLKIIVVTSPFCGFCAEAHTIITAILQKYPETVCFDIRFNFDKNHNDEESKKIHQQLVAIYFNQGQAIFTKALHDWFETKDATKLDSLANTGISELKLNLILEEQFNWNQVNEINYTPAIMINNYIYPKQYDSKNLIHFINDLSDDEDFQS
jgi:Thioredoxin/Vitamin K epoxide reductase family